MKIEIFSDLACPWCYIAKRRVEQALAAFGHEHDVELEWKSFELTPDMPASSPLNSISYLGRKGVPPERARALIHNCTTVAAGDGLTLRFDKLRLFNTNKAHQVLHYAKTVGLQNRLAERLFHAAFTEGRELGLDEDLVELAGEVGLDEAAVAAALEAQTFAPAVMEDRRLAQSLGINSVPYLILDGRHAMPGLQPVADYVRAFEAAWRETHPVVPLTADVDGARPRPHP